MENNQICGREVPMTTDTGPSLILISLKTWRQIGEPKLKNGIRNWNKRPPQDAIYQCSIFYG